MNMVFIRRLEMPMEVKAAYPLTAELAAIARRRMAEVADILSGRDDRFLLIIGPCSADREDSVLEYLHRLRRLQEAVGESVYIVPRIYTNKPRTVGKGYMGLVHQPDPEEEPDLYSGLVASRQLHMKALTETGFTCADEMLYPENIKYLDDLLCYVAVGARSVENQQHRLTASGLDQAVGMKNPTGGDLSVMLNAVETAQGAHAFIYRGWDARSSGNPCAHCVLRGYTTRHGAAMPNYHYEDLLLLGTMYEERQLKNPAVIIDTNHANSAKQPLEQARIAKEVLHSRRLNPAIRQLVKGLMVESYLADGSQPVGGGRYGVSITDPCLGWEKSERLVMELAEAVEK